MSYSLHFSHDELKCPCCGKNEMNIGFLEILENVRTEFGKPMVITSGYRCPKHNAEVGGVKGSAHLSGLAVDVQIVDSVIRHQLLEVVLKNPRIIGIGINKSFIHLDGKERSNRVVFLY